jgi:hypothetical protein
MVMDMLKEWISHTKKTGNEYEWKKTHRQTTHMMDS